MPEIDGNRGYHKPRVSISMGRLNCDKPLGFSFSLVAMFKTRPHRPMSPWIMAIALGEASPVYGLKSCCSKLSRLIQIWEILKAYETRFRCQLWQWSHRWRHGLSRGEKNPRWSWRWRRGAMRRVRGAWLEMVKMYQNVRPSDGMSGTKV